VAESADPDAERERTADFQDRGQPAIGGRNFAAEIGGNRWRLLGSSLVMSSRNVMRTNRIEGNVVCHPEQRLLIFDQQGLVAALKQVPGYGAKPIEARREDVVPIVSPIDDVIESTRKLHPKLPRHASNQRESIARSSSNITNSGAALARDSPGSLPSETCNASTPSAPCGPTQPFSGAPLGSGSTQRLKPSRRRPMRSNASPTLAGQPSREPPCVQRQNRRSRSATR